MSNADPQIILQGGRITGMADGEQPDDAATLRQSGALTVTGPIPVAFDSANIGTTGFPVLDVVAGDIVCGWGVNLITPWTDVADVANGFVHVTDSGGVVTIAGGSCAFAESGGDGDTDAQTLSAVSDGWTLILNDTQLVLVVVPGAPPSAGSAELYIALMHPTAP